MQACRPRYVLIAEAETVDTGHGWRFALLAADGSASIAASDVEEGADEERLVLLAAVRGLEALDQPSAVTLVTRSASVQRGVTRGLEAWRNNHWRWERFGRLTPVRDADLWRRVDQAMRFHRVRCQTWWLDAAELASSTIGPDADVEPLEELAAEPSTPPRYVSSRFDSPAMVIVRTPRARRRVRLAPTMAAAG